MNSTEKVDKYSDEIYEILKTLNFPDASNLDDKTTIMSYATALKSKRDFIAIQDLFDKYGIKGMGTPFVELAKKMYDAKQEDDIPASKSARELNQLLDTEIGDGNESESIWEDDEW